MFKLKRLAKFMILKISYNTVLHDKNMLHKLSYILVSLFFISFTRPALADFPHFSDSEKEFLVRNQTIRYSEVNWEPMSCIDALPTYGGMIADYLDLISKRSGLRFKYVYAGQSWQDVLDKYNQHEIELLPALAKEDKIGRAFLYTDPFVVFPLVVATRPDVDFISQTSDLSGKRIGVGKGYTSYHFLKNNYPDIQLVETPDVYTGLKLLNDAKIDAFVGHLAVVAFNINKSGYDLKITGKTEFNFEHRIGIDPRFPEVVSIINKTLNTVTKKEQNQIYNKWVRLPQEAKIDYGPIFKVALGSVLLLLASLSVTLFVVRRNKRLEQLKRQLETSKKELSALNASLEEKIADRTEAIQHAHNVTKTLSEEKDKSLLLAWEMSARNELILQSVSEGIFGVDKHGKMTFVNASAEKLLGYLKDELLGQVIHPIIHRLDNRNPCLQDDCVVLKTIRNGIIQEEETFYTRQDGTCFPVQIVSTPIFKNNEIIGAVVVFRDISEHLENEKRLLDTQKFLAIGQLAAGISHEIKTPLQYINNNIEFIAGGVRDMILFYQSEQSLWDIINEENLHEMKEKASFIKTQYDIDYLCEELHFAIGETTYGVNQIVNIVQSMKELCHPGDGDMTDVNLNSIIKNAATISKNEWKYVAELKTNLDPNLSTFQCNPDSWIQMLINLIVNCAHAIEERQVNNPNQGIIEIITRELEDHIELKVMDNGTGIDDGKKTLIFKPFYTTKKVGKGTGQGLAFAKNLIEKVHEGIIACDNRPEGGAVFEIRIPRVSVA